MLGDKRCVGSGERVGITGAFGVPENNNGKSVVISVLKGGYVWGNIFQAQFSVSTLGWLRAKTLEVKCMIDMVLVKKHMLQNV